MRRHLRAALAEVMALIAPPGKHGLALNLIRQGIDTARLIGTRAASRRSGLPESACMMAK